MRQYLIGLLIAFTAACGSEEMAADLAVSNKDLAISDLEPDATLLPGLWQEPGSGYIWRFTADGKQQLGATAATIDSQPLTSGTWLLEGSRLLLDNTVGYCAAPIANQVGIYDITLSISTLTLKLRNDSCPERRTIDGEAWTRVQVDGG